MHKQLHIYGQHAWHMDVHIVGEKESLIALRDAIDRAIATNQPQVMGAFTNDGEGFNVFVTPLEESQCDELALPYIDDDARERSDEAKWPHDLISSVDHMRLAAEPWKGVRDFNFGKES